MQRFTFLLVPLAIIAFVALPAVDAASTTSIARLGATHGASRLTANGPNTVYVNAKSLSPGAWAVRLYLGTCSRLSTRIVTLSSLIVGSRRAAARTYTITASQARLGAAGVILLSRGSTRICGKYAPEVARPLPSPSASATTSPRPTSTASPSPSASATTSPSTTLSPTSTVVPAPTPAPGTIMVDRNGHGSASSATFMAPRQWEIDYQYTCSGSEAQAFTISLSANGGPATQVLTKSGASGGGSQPMTTSGSVQLQITTACSWQVFAIAD